MPCQEGHTWEIKTLLVSYNNVHIKIGIIKPINKLIINIYKNIYKKIDIKHFCRNLLKII